jgi:hypothetical protein
MPCVASRRDAIVAAVEAYNRTPPIASSRNPPVVATPQTH